MSRKKIRPNPGDPITEEMSERDIAATGIATRREIQRWKELARIPEDEFEQLLEAERVPSSYKIVETARGRDPARRRAGYCPHCGGKLN
jgi:hypothetical protein